MFGNGSSIPGDSSGVAVLRWWDGAGTEIVVGVPAFVVLLLRRTVAPRAVLLGIAAGLVTVACRFVVLLVALCARSRAH